VSKCLYKVKEVLSPYQQEFRGYRILVAWPNLAGTKPYSSEKCPSFERPYLITMFGDYEDTDTLAEVLEVLPKTLRRMGFTVIERYGD
jgi:hypothetical protein